MIVDGRYRMGPRLGRGGMADVHEAWDLRLERRVAIKQYRAATHGVGLRRFMSEAELLGQLSHPGLLTVFDVGFDGERPFLVMSLATGGTLRDRLDTGPLLPARVAEIGAAVAEVLAYVHARGIVHRDIKPSNVLFDADGDCYLADFGIARAMGSAHITDSNEFIGTAAYLAPEQVEDRAPGQAADVYALGLVLLECLTGHPEYNGTDVEMAMARLSRPPRIPGTWGQEWRAVLTAMTEADPADRPDAEACVTLLRALEAGQTVPMAVPARRRSPRIYATAATVAVAVAAAVAFTAGPALLPGDPTVDPRQIVPSPEPPAVAPQVPAPAQPPPTEQSPTSHAGEAAETDGKGPPATKENKSGKGKGNGKSGKG